MCGRYVLILDNDFSQRFEVAPPGPDIVSSYNIAPGRDVPIVAATSSDRTLSLVRWGLRPPWMNGPHAARGIINVRAETAMTKSTFRAALAHGRILIPATGFYEWRALASGAKQPYLFRTSDPYVSFAGIRDGDGVAILTTTANATVSPIHARMPVILRRDDEAAWLDVSLSSADVTSLLVPAADTLLTATAISRAVNDARRDDPSLLESQTDSQSPATDAPGGT